MEKALNKSLSILLSLAMIIGLFAAAPISANAEITVTYLDADGTLKSAEVVPLASKDLTPGWYAVMSDLTFNDRMLCSGDVHLILCDGCTLSAKMGITVNKNNSLTIYGQSKGTGHLNATQTGLLNYPAVIGSNGDRDSGLITINGGSINAKNEGLGGAAIGGGSWGFGTVVINGGNIEATTDRGGSSIGGGAGAGGDVTIKGGIIYAENKYYNVAIGGGGKQGGAQTVVTINGGEVTAKAASGPAIGTDYDVRCVINIKGNYEVIVNTSASENGASQWDKATALSTYKYIQITKYKVLTGSITNGTLTSDLHYYDPGEVVTLTCEADNGYHLHSVSLAPVYEISSREIPLTAIDGTNANGSQSCHHLVDDNSESKWVTSKENSYIIMDAQNKVEMTGYSLITGNDNESYDGRNWKNYTIYGANFESVAHQSGMRSKPLLMTMYWRIETARDMISLLTVPPKNIAIIKSRSLQIKAVHLARCQNLY